jgi:PST family polysaccharide transporter
MKESRTAKALRGGLFSISAKVINLLAGVLAVVILARIFTPVEYGQFGILLLITTICLTLPNAIGQSMIHEGTAEPSGPDSYFWIFVATVMVLVVVLLVAQRPILAFFANGLRHAEYWWLFVLVPLASTAAFLDARLSQIHRFEVLAAGDMVMQIVGAFLITLILSRWLSGVHALILGTVCGYVLKTGLQLWTLRTSRAPDHPRHVRRRLTFIGYFTAIQGANYFGLNGDNLVVARVLGLADLGNYGRAYNLMSKPVTTLSSFIASVYFPLMVSVRDDAAAFRSGYLKALAFAALAGFPLSIYLPLVSTDLVPVLLGPRWQATAVPFAILALASYFRLSYRVTETVGLTRSPLLNSAARQTLYAVAVVGGALAGSRYGVVGVAAGVAGALAMFFVFSLAQANRTARCPALEYLKASFPAALGAALAAAVMLAVWALSGSTDPLPRLLESCSYWVAYGLFWLAACKLFTANMTVTLLREATRRRTS